MTQQITVREALEQGYKFYGEEDQEGLDRLDDIDSEEKFKEIKDSHSTLYLASRIASPANIHDGSDLCEIIGEHAIEEIHECGVEEVIDIIQKYAPEFDVILKKIEEEIGEKQATCTYEQTEIELTGF